MAIQIGGTTVIDNSRNITNVGIITVGTGGTTGRFNVGTGVTIDGAGNAYFDGFVTVNGGINYLVGLTSIYPQNTNLPDAGIYNTWNGNLLLYFDAPVEVAAGSTLTVKLRKTSSGGVAIGTAGVSSITTPGGDFSVLNVAFGYKTEQKYDTFYPVIPKGIIKFSLTGNDYAGNYSGEPDQNLCSFQYGMGASYGGGYLICESAAIRWIIAPSTSQVSRDFSSVNDANTRAQQVSGCTGWFVPTRSQLQNPMYSCISYWDSYSASDYWSSTSVGGFYPVPPDFPNYTLFCYLNMGNGSAAGTQNSGEVKCVRSLRCVSY